MSSVSSIWFGLLLCAVVASADVQSDVRSIVKAYPWKGSSDISILLSPHSSPRRSAANIQPSLEELFQVPAVKDLVDYFEKHGIQAEKIFVTFLKSLHQYRAFANAKSIGEVVDIMIKTLSSPEIKAVVEQKMKTDPEFAKLAEVVQTAEFKTLFYRALNAKATCPGCNAREVRGFGFSFGFGFSIGK